MVSLTYCEFRASYISPNARQTMYMLGKTAGVPPDPVYRGQGLPFNIPRGGSMT